VNDTDAKDRTFRHGLTCLWPSEIADQFYCEYKVHLKRLHPEVQIELPSVELGEASHTALVSQAEPVTPAEIDQSIRAGKKLAICEWVLDGCFQGVRIRGRPDFFAFEGKKALLLLDFKFSSAKRPFRDHEMQAEVYALLVESMGFSSEELYLAIAILPGAGHMARPGETAKIGGAELRSFAGAGTLHTIYEQCQQRRKTLLSSPISQTIVEGDNWKTFLFRYDREKATKDLSWALKYWLHEREPKPEKRNERKCRACALNAAGLCEHALQGPDLHFEVQRRPDGRVFVSKGDRRIGLC